MYWFTYLKFLKKLPLDNIGNIMHFKFYIKVINYVYTDIVTKYEIPE